MEYLYWNFSPTTTTSTTTSRTTTITFYIVLFLLLIYLEYVLFDNLGIFHYKFFWKNLFSQFSIKFNLKLIPV